MAVRTDSPNSAAITVVNRLFVLLIHSVPHLMTGGAECQSISCLHAGIKSTPKQDTRNKGNGENGEDGILGARLLDEGPKPL